MLLEPTHHQLQNISHVRGWEQQRKEFLYTATECSAMPSGQVCLFCINPAAYRCKSCGPLAFFCRNCFYVQDNEDDDDTDSEQEWEFNELIAIASYFCYSISTSVLVCHLLALMLTTIIIYTRDLNSK